MRPTLHLCWILLGCAWAAANASPVTVTPASGASGAGIPDDFIGLSVEISNLLPGKDGQRIFSGKNSQLIHLFRAAGIRNLRVGGGTAEPKAADFAHLERFRMPGPEDIDALFAFAEAADVQVIYTLRLLGGDREATAITARYIMERYHARLQSFSLGNEPDWHAYHTYPGHQLDPEIVETSPGEPGSAYQSFFAKWMSFATAVQRVAPGAVFAGPDTGSNFPVPGSKDTDYEGRSWTEQLVRDVHGTLPLTATLHDYVGQGAEGVSVQSAIDAMLSPQWRNKNYPALFKHAIAPVQSLGVPYRLTECNDHTGGVDGASNAFVSALWALDYMHWHAAHGAAGVNFHNKRWIFTCTVIQDKDGQFLLNPKAYGLKAFSLGSHGHAEPVSIDNPENVNLTAYAVHGAAERLITVINMEHGPGARPATISIPLPASGARVMFLTAPAGDPAARTGITLGGAVIQDDGSWRGDWTALEPASAGTCLVEVPPTSAAIVRIPDKAPDIHLAP